MPRSPRRSSAYFGCERRAPAGRLRNVLLVDSDDNAVLDREPVQRVLAAVGIRVGLPALHERCEEGVELARLAVSAEGTALRGDLRVVRDSERLRGLVGVADVVVVRHRLAGRDGAVLLRGLLRLLAGEELGLVEGERGGRACCGDAADVTEALRSRPRRGR